MQPHPEQNDPQPDRSQRRLLLVALVGVVIVVIVLLHVLGVIHG
jgi:hypothetical protein